MLHLQVKSQLHWLYLQRVHHQELQPLLMSRLLPHQRARPQYHKDLRCRQDAHHPQRLLHRVLQHLPLVLPLHHSFHHQRTRPQYLKDLWCLQDAHHPQRLLYRVLQHLPLVLPHHHSFHHQRTRPQYLKDLWCLQDAQKHLL